jgi:hypothetical protein
MMMMTMMMTMMMMTTMISHDGPEGIEEVAGEVVAPLARHDHHAGQDLPQHARALEVVPQPAWRGEKDVNIMHQPVWSQAVLSVMHKLRAFKSSHSLCLEGISSVESGVRTGEKAAWHTHLRPCGLARSRKKWM